MEFAFPRIYVLATNLQSKDAVAKSKSNINIKVKDQRVVCNGHNEESLGPGCPPTSFGTHSLELLILPPNCPQLLPTRPLVQMF